MRRERGLGLRGRGWRLRGDTGQGHGFLLDPRAGGASGGARGCTVRAGRPAPRSARGCAPGPRPWAPPWPWPWPRSARPERRLHREAPVSLRRTWLQLGMLWAHSTEGKTKVRPRPKQGPGLQAAREVEEAVGGGPWSPWRERLLDCVVSGFWPPNPRGFPGPGRWGPLLWTLPALLRSPGTSGRSLASEVPAYTRRAAVARRAVGTTGARSPALPAQGHGLGGEASEGPGLVHGRVTNTCPPAGRGVLP